MRLVEEDITETEQLPTGLEGADGSDTSRAPQHIKRGKRQTRKVMKKTLQCDVFCAYSEESGNAQFDQTFMRDIISFLKHGHMKYASAATHCGEPIPIGDDLASAKPSDYDTERLERLKVIRADQKRLREAEEAVRKEKEEEERRVREQSGDASTAQETSDDLKKALKKVLRKRRTAGQTKATATASAGDMQVEVTVESTDRRGKLHWMRLFIKLTDGCGVQYVQRQSAHGTASLYADIQAIAQQAADAAARFGVIGLHIVCEPHCFKGIHDAAGKVFVDNKNKGVMGRDWTISNVEQHYDYNAATMLKPKHANYNFECAAPSELNRCLRYCCDVTQRFACVCGSFSFSNYYHVLYKKDDFIDLESHAVQGIKSWRFTEGGTNDRATARGGIGGGCGYTFFEQPHVRESDPYPGTPLHR